MAELVTVFADKPKAIYIELTDRCNLRCPMCRPSGYTGNIMTLEMFGSIARCLFPHAAFVDLRGWGESTIIDEFDQYLKIAAAYPVRLKLITNATVNRPELWRNMTRLGVSIGVSFDAARSATFSRLRGGASITKVLQNVRVIWQGYQYAGRDPQEYLYFCITVSGANLCELCDIIEIGHNIGVRRFKLEPLNTQLANPDHLRHHARQIKHVLKQLRDLVKRYDLLVELSASLTADTAIRQAVEKLCIHPWEYLYVNARGRLGFCDHLNGREEFTFSDWSQETFDNFWNGNMMQQLRNEHLRKLATKDAICLCPECNWCYTNRYIDMEDWVRPDWSKYRVVLGHSEGEPSG